MIVKAHGRFIKKDDFVYRTDTYLKFGESDQIIGACVLCNPGSSSLKNKTEEEYLINYDDGKYEIEGELKLDDTMEQVRDILMEAYGNELKGKFKIFNTFTIRNSNMDKAKELLKNEDVDKDLLFQDFRRYKDEFSDFRYILIGWGCEDFSVLKAEKKRWLKFINDNNINHIGIKGKKSPHYYHPLPRIAKDRKRYKGVITEAIKEVIKE